MSQSSLKFFLGADGAALAFEKENPFATWPATAHVLEASAPTTPPSGAAIATDCFDATDYRNVILHVTPSDTGATWAISVHHAKKGGGINSSVMYKLMDSEVEAKTGRQVIGVDVFGLDYIFIKVDAISAGNITIEVAPIEVADG